MERILLFSILSLDVSIVLDKQINELHVICLNSVVKGTISRLRFLIIDVHCHICCVVLVHHPCDSVIVTLLRCFQEISTFDQVLVPPGSPHHLVLVLELGGARALTVLRFHLGRMQIPRWRHVALVMRLSHS